jgi:hypothetical protein
VTFRDHPEAARQRLFEADASRPAGEQEDDVSERESREATARVLHVDDDRRSGAFFPPPSAVPTDERDKRDEKPLHYKVICISMYTDDLKRLDTMVETLKSRGMTKANRSALIRYALSTVDLEQVPKGL